MATRTVDKRTTLDINEIRDIIPHRYPFLLIDRVLHFDLEEGLITAQKNVTINEPFFNGHWPDEPIMPGVLILEAFAQAGAVISTLRKKEDKTAVLLNIKSAKFRRPVRPGDVLMIEGNQSHFSTNGGRMLAKGMVDDQLVAQAEFAYAFMEHRDGLPKPTVR